ncbi:MAG: hypothetical protein LEGION0398_MBIBDBAK_01377 [Legionellaceae bacterium]
MAQQDRKIGLKVPTRKVTNKTNTSLTDPDASLAFKAGTPSGLKYKIHSLSAKEATKERGR